MNGPGGASPPGLIIRYPYCLALWRSARDICLDLWLTDDTETWYLLAMLAWVTGSFCAVAEAYSAAAAQIGAWTILGLAMAAKSFHILAGHTCSEEASVQPHLLVKERLHSPHGRLMLVGGRGLA